MKNYKFTIDGNKYDVDVIDIVGKVAQVEVNGIAYDVEIEAGLSSAPKVVKPKVIKAAPAATAAPVQPQVHVPQAAPAATTAFTVKSPLPGTILDIFVNVGDTVKSGQRIILLEAMKMENNIDAERDGVIASINVNKSDSVMEGDVLLTIQ